MDTRITARQEVLAKVFWNIQDVGPRTILAATVGDLATYLRDLSERIGFDRSQCWIVTARLEGFGTVGKREVYGETDLQAIQHAKELWTDWRHPNITLSARTFGSHAPRTVLTFGGLALDARLDATLTILKNIDDARPLRSYVVEVWVGKQLALREVVRGANMWVALDQAKKGREDLTNVSWHIYPENPDAI